jgi:hypothetical protein
MFSNSLKRTVATLGVLAGVLAVAGPASAQGGGDDRPTESVSFLKAPMLSAGAGKDRGVTKAGGEVIGSDSY